MADGMLSSRQLARSVIVGSRPTDVDARTDCARRLFVLYIDAMEWDFDVNVHVIVDIRSLEAEQL